MLKCKGLFVGNYGTLVQIVLDKDTFLIQTIISYKIISSSRHTQSWSLWTMPEIYDLSCHCFAHLWAHKKKITWNKELANIMTFAVPKSTFQKTIHYGSYISSGKHLQYRVTGHRLDCVIAILALQKLKTQKCDCPILTLRQH